MSTTFLAPAKKQNRINSFRKWEQAFHIYATIYCSKNPQRSREIWQYISVINTAANSYVWDNVYNYDIIFRQLMQFNPNRSWATTYNQMWNLSMREPLNQAKNFKPGNSYAQNFSGASGGKNLNSSGGNCRKSDYCWNFNKGLKCKFDPKCKFIERYSYCDSGTHGIISCPKLEKGGNKKPGSSGKVTGASPYGFCSNRSA